MKMRDVIESGISGTTTLALLQEALHKIDSGSPRPLLHKSGIIKKLKKSKKGRKSGKLFIRLGSELLTNVASFGLIGLGKKKDVVLRGGLLGAIAGLASAFLQEDNEEKKKDDYEGDPLMNGDAAAAPEKNDTWDKITTVALYTAGGLLAGVAIKKLGKKNKKGKRKN